MDTILVWVFLLGLGITILGWAGLAGDGLYYWWLSYDAKHTPHRRSDFEGFIEDYVRDAIVTREKELTKNRLKFFGLLIVLGWMAMALWYYGYYLFIHVTSSK
ncbi:hypothetical protein KA078_03380 [Candidatus Woesebacteria bacterium]|nr:hypothetical protein [Candidatus Woesebacteria bacterium]